MSGELEILGSGIAFPIRVDARGSFAMAAGVADVEQAMRLILDTAPGERPMRPEFGCEVHDFVFESIDAESIGRIEDAIRAALDRWEPRIVVEEVTFDSDEPGVLLIGIRYRVKATNDARNLVYPFYVIPEDER